MNVMPPFPIASVQHDWPFRPSRAPLTVTARRIKNRLSRRDPAPARRLLKAPDGRDAWTLYFAYLPDGVLTTAHRFTLDRLRRLDRGLLVVCATPSPTDIPAELADACDALLWKDLPGFDFSAYAAGLLLLAERCPGSDVLVLNDSTFGPLVDLKPWLDRARWDLTGFTATSNVESHIQSYAFHLRGVTEARMADLASVIMPRHAFHDFWPVVLNQETRFARVAHRTMSVGAFHYVDTHIAEDPTLQLALPLVSAGFPFLKRSLLGKLSHLHQQADVRATLAAAGFPV